jgi:hypothetical protein
VLALEETNTRYSQYATKKAGEEQKRQHEEEDHRRRVLEQAKRIKFD